MVNKSGDITTERTPACNTGLAKVAVQWSANTFVVNQSLVLRINPPRRMVKIPPIANLQNVVQHYKNRNMNYLVILLSTLLLVSCATTNMTTNSGLRYVVEVDSYGEDSTLLKKDCFLYISDSTINTSDLQFQEFYGYIAKILTNKGYSIVDSIESANIIVFFNYGISDPNTQEYTRSVPVWGQTGISSTTTTGNVYVNPYSNNIQYKQNTYSTPTYGVAGYRTVQGSYTTYLRYLNLVAYDFDYYVKNNKERRIWQTVITSTGPSNDLRKVIPSMLIGAQKYIGHSSYEKKEISIYENNPSLQMLKGQ